MIDIEDLTPDQKEAFVKLSGFQIDEIDPEQWLFIGENQAVKKIKENERERVYTFNSFFIFHHLKPILKDEMNRKDIREMQEIMQDRCNELIFCLIEDYDEFIEDAIKDDGKGHYLSHYDSEELALPDNICAYRLF